MITQHFDKEEFNCNCGKNQINTQLVERLEKLFQLIGADKIIISSGYRCPDCSVKVGGYRNDMHTKGGAADLIVYKDGKALSSKEVCAIAETSGLFNGIAIINQNYCHLDIRGVISYSNNKWFGNEITGENYNTFKEWLPAWFTAKPQSKKLRLFLGEELIFEKEV